MDELNRSNNYSLGRPAPRDSLVDVLDRVLDKGVVIAGDIAINLLDIELLTIKVRLLVASVDKAKEMGIDWWQHDPQLSSRAGDGDRKVGGREQDQLREENQMLRQRLARLESRVNALPADDSRVAPLQKQRRKAAAGKK